MGYPAIFAFHHIDERIGGAAAHLLMWHVHGGQGRQGETGKLRVVKPGDRDIARHIKPHIPRAVHGTQAGGEARLLDLVFGRAVRDIIGYQLIEPC